MTPDTPDRIVTDRNRLTFTPEGWNQPRTVEISARLWAFARRRVGEIYVKIRRGEVAPQFRETDRYAVTILSLWSAVLDGVDGGRLRRASNQESEDAGQGAHTIPQAFRPKRVVRKVSETRRVRSTRLRLPCWSSNISYCR